MRFSGVPGNAHRERRTPAVATYLGRDLRVYFTITAVSERPGDGILLVRSMDPSKLLVSAGYSLPGTDRLILHDVDRSSNPIVVGFDALSDTGEVDVLLEGRTAESFPARRFRVRLAPSAISFVPPVDVRVQAGFSFQVHAYRARFCRAAAWDRL